MRTLLVIALVLGCDSSSTPAPAKATSAKAETKDTKPDSKPDSKPEVKTDTKADAKPDPTPAAKPGLTWTIETEPKTLKLAELDKLRVRVTVTNGGDAPASPIREVRSYTVDGKASQSLNLAFNNGGKGKGWSGLPPGESVQDSRIGVAFTDAAGDHTIAMMDASGAELASVVVHIDP